MSRVEEIRERSRDKFEPVGAGRTVTTADIDRAWLLERLDTASARVQSLEAALRDQMTRWASVPSGVDYFADEDEQSPEDMVAHVAGLAVKAIRSILSPEAVKEKDETKCE